jgi:hypothetical protein
LKHFQLHPLQEAHTDEIIFDVNGIITQSRSPEIRSITLHTKRGACVSNEQCDISSWDRAHFRDIDDRWPLTEKRCEPTGIFNCHGLTFASRRTSVSDSNEVRKILEHDGYEVVNKSDVLPGDVILYAGAKGDIEHSGIVVERPSGDFNIPKVVSKWGKFRELIHMANQCPYNYLAATYCRIKR